VKRFFRAFAAVHLLLAGCASVARLPLAEPASLRAPGAGELPGADAAYVLWEHEHRIHLGLRLPSYEQHSYHCALAVLNESGLRFTKVRVPYDAKDGAVLYFDARTLEADGRVHVLSPENVYDDDLASGESEGRARASRVRVFALPRVSVGSVVEYRYAVRSPGYRIWGDEFLWQDLPARRVSTTLRYNGRAGFRVKTYNTQTPVRWSEEGDETVGRWTGERLPGRTGEPFGDYQADFVPRLAWVMTRRTQPYLEYYNRDWADAVGPYFKEIFGKRGKLRAGFEPPPEAAAGATRRDQVHAALGWVKALRYVGHEALEPRPLADVVHSRTADNYEQVLLLQALLEARGVDAQMVLTRPAKNGRLDPAFPTQWAFKSALVLVPAQPGLEAPLWLDPTCASCRPGELDWDVAGTTALRLGREGRVVGEDKPDAQLVQVPDSVPAPEVYAESTDVQVRDDGSVDARTVYDYDGTMSDWRVLRDWKSNDDERTRMVRKWIDGAAPGATPGAIEFLYPAQPGAHASIVASWRAADLATGGGRRLLVLLTLLDLPCRGDFEKPVRDTDIRFPSSKLERHSVVVRPPPGMNVCTDVEPAAADAGFASYRTQVEREPGRVAVRVEVLRRRGLYPKSRVGELREFFRTVRAVRDRAVAVSREPCPAPGVPPAP